MIRMPMTQERVFALCIVLAIMAFFTVLAALFVAGCASATPAAAETAYTTQLLECASNEPSKAASRACRAEVDRKWHVDAGADR